MTLGKLILPVKAARLKSENHFKIHCSYLKPQVSKINKWISPEKSEDHSQQWEKTIYLSVGRDPM